MRYYMFVFIVSCVVRCLSSRHSLGNPIGRFVQTLKMSTNIVRNQICRRRWATRSRPTTPNTIDKCAWREKKKSYLVAVIDYNFPSPCSNRWQKLLIRPIYWWRRLDNSLRCSGVDMNWPCIRMELDLGHVDLASMPSHRLKLSL